MKVILASYAIAFATLILCAVRHGALSGVELGLLIFDGLLFTMSVFVASAMQGSFLADRPNTDDVLKILVWVVLAGGLCLGLIVGLATSGTFPPPHLTQDAIAWRRAVLAFTAFIAIVPLALLLEDTRKRTRQARTVLRLTAELSECQDGGKDQGSESATKTYANEEIKEKRLPAKVAVCVSIAGLIILVAWCHDYKGARHRK
jgi:hypothetical protein